MSSIRSGIALDPLLVPMTTWFRTTLGLTPERCDHQDAVEILSGRLPGRQGGRP